MKIDRFSTFWPFSIKLVGAEHVLRPVTMQVSAVGPVDSCDSKSACNSLFFGCIVTAGGIGTSGELVLAEYVVRLEIALFWVV